MENYCLVHTTHSVQVPPHTVAEIGQLVTVGPDWAGTLARLLHKSPPQGDYVDEVRVLEWAGGLEPVPDWAAAAMGRLLGIRAGLLTLQAERCNIIARNLRGEPER